MSPVAFDFFRRWRSRPRGDEAPTSGDESGGVSAEPELPPRVRLLTDGADAVEPADLLEHRAIALAVAAAIRETDAREPLGIGLYGGWGQGKSTIGRILRQVLGDEIEAGRIVFVKIDAWKYAHEGTRLPLRRHFLLQAYLEAGFEDEVRKMSARFWTERTKKEPRVAVRPAAERVKRWAISLPRPRFWTTFTVGLLIFLVVLLVPIASLADRLLWVVSFAFALAVIFLTAFAPILREGLYVTTREDPAWSAEQFDARLHTLLERTKGTVERFIFFIDDLDRCNDALVVEAIETLQAFFGQPRCAYIVAADEKQLKRAVRAASQGPARALVEGSPVPADETFLEKIFQVTTQVPQPSLPAIERYATEVATSTRLGELDAEGRNVILSYLVHPRVTSPRQVRVIINDFIISWAEAEERESEERAYLAPGELTDHKPLLAKLVTLRSHFPWFYDLLFDDPGLLMRWQGHVLSLEPSSDDAAIEMESVVRGASARAIEELSDFAEGDEVEVAAPRREQVRPEELLDPLRNYLSLTRDARPKDAGHVQEFLYLRSRREFADLTGEAGESYRLAIASGDQTALRALLPQDPAQVLPALRAALTFGREPNPVQRRAALRAITTLVTGLSEEELQDNGLSVARVLYADDQSGIANLDEMDGAEVARRLAPWMPRNVVDRYAVRPFIKEPRDLAALATRLAAFGLEGAWRAALGFALREFDAKTVDEGVHLLSPGVSAKLADATVEVAREVLQSAPDRIDDLTLTYSGSEGRFLSFTDEEGDARRIYVPGDAELDVSTLVPGTAFRISAHQDSDGDLVLEKLESEDDNEIVSLPEKPVTSQAEREYALNVAEAVIRGGLPRSTHALSSLAGIEFQTEEDATRVSEFARRVISLEESEPRVELADSLLMLVGRGFSSASLTALLALRLLPSECLEPFVEDLLREGGELAQEELDAQQKRSLRTSMAGFAQRVRGRDFQKGIRELKLPNRLEKRLKVIELVMAPVDAAAASRELGDLGRRYARSVEEAERSGEEASLPHAELMRVFDVFETVGSQAPRTVRTSVRSLPDRPITPMYAERILQLRNAINGLDLSLAAPIIRAASENSRRGVSLVLEHGLKGRSIRKEQLEAILEAMTKHVLGSADLARAKRVVDRNKAVMPIIDQMAVVARQRRPRLVERLYGDDALAALFEEAQTVMQNEPGRARGLLNSTAAWSGLQKAVRRRAADSFANLLDTVQSELELQIVLSAALAFFSDAKKVEHRSELKRALRGVLERLPPLSESETHDLLEATTSQLRLQPSGQSWLTRLINEKFKTG